MSDNQVAEQAPLDPYKTMCVVKHNGREVGRIAACANRAEAYITELVRQYGSVSVDYEFDANASMLAMLTGGGVNVLPR